MVTRYALAYSFEGAQDLVNIVNKFIRDAWEPQRGVSYCSVSAEDEDFIQLTQAMIKRS